MFDDTYNADIWGEEKKTRTTTTKWIIMFSSPILCELRFVGRVVAWVVNKLKMAIGIGIVCVAIVSCSLFSISFRIGTDDQECVDVISTYKLPKSDLLDQCESLHENKSDTVNVYRRLLAANYVDGLSKVCIIFTKYYTNSL